MLFRSVDMGISSKRTEEIIAIKAPITSSFLTYGKSLNLKVQNAVDAGHEIMLHAPMEPHSDADIAPDVLTTNMKPETIKKSLEIMIDKFSNINGINNHMGSKFTEDFEAMNAVMEVLKEKDLFFLDSKTSAFSAGRKVAKLNGVPYATRHVFLDNYNNLEYIRKQLAITEKIAKRNGFAIAIGHPKSHTAIAVKEWVDAAEEKGFKLVHLSDIVNVIRASHLN